MFLDLILGEHAYPKGSGLKRTAGDTTKPVDCYEWTSTIGKQKLNQQKWTVWR